MTGSGSCTPERAPLPLASTTLSVSVAVAPLSYGPVQFRISEALKALVLVQPWLIPGIMAGTFVANLFSPYVGPWELIWMPLTDGLGGLLAWWIGRRWSDQPGVQQQHRCPGSGHSVLQPGL